MNVMRVAVVTITCRKCGRVVKQSIPRVAEPDEIENEAPCSPAFADCAGCPDHPPGRPDAGPPVPLTGMAHSRYSDPPLLWTVRLLELPIRLMNGAEMP